MSCSSFVLFFFLQLNDFYHICPISKYIAITLTNIIAHICLKYCNNHLWSSHLCYSSFTKYELHKRSIILIIIIMKLVEFKFLILLIIANIIDVKISDIDTNY